MLNLPTAVVFDLFGTLVPPVDDRTYEASVIAVATALGANASEVVDLWLHDSDFSRRFMTTGSSTRDQIDHTCERLSLARSLAVREQAAAVHLASHRRWMEPFSGSLGTLRALRGRQLRLGLVSDCSVSVPELWPSSPLCDLIDCPLFSCVEGVTKPSAVLYKAVADRLGVRPAHCLYVGDGLHELEGAESSGMTAVLLDATRSHRHPSWSGPRVDNPTGVLAMIG